MLSKTFHVKSVVQPQFYKATRILFVRKENKNNNLIQQFFSSKSRIPPLSRLPQHVRVLRQQHLAHLCLHAEGLSIMAEDMIWRRKIVE